MEKDKFWDLNEYFIPKNRNITPTKKDTRTISITLDGEEKKDNRYEKIPERIEPVKTAKSSRGFSYKRDNSLIRNVAVTPWTGNVKTYANFDEQVVENYDKTINEIDYMPFTSYFPTYSSLTKSQFEYYIYWRTMIREGKIIKCDSSYIFLYINECISSLSFVSPESVIDSLIFVWQNYRDEYNFLDKYVCEYITDISLIYNIRMDDRKYENIEKVYKSLSLPEVFMASDYSNITYSYIEEITKYSYKDNKFYKMDSKIFDEYLEEGALEGIKRLLNDKEYMEGQTLSHELKESFNGACVSEKNKNWISISYISPRRNQTLRSMFISIIKLCENHIRSSMGIKTKYSIVPCPPNSVNEFLNQYYSEKLKYKTVVSLPKEPEYMKYYEPSFDNANSNEAKDIENDAWQTVEMLEGYTDEYVDLNIPIVYEETKEDETGYSAFINSLNSEQKECLNSVISGTLDKYIKEKHIVKDEIIRQINDIAYEKTGDIIIENDIIIEDYYDDLLESMGGKE